VRICAIDLGGDVDVRKIVSKLGVRPPTAWDEPIEFSAQGKDLLLYSFGALIGIDVEPSKLVEVAQGLLEFVEGGRLGDLEEVEVLEGKGKEDAIYVERMSGEALRMIAFALAQSVALSRMERTMDEIEEEVEKVLSEKRMGRRALKVAKELMKTRHELISDVMILEKPSAAWEDEYLENVYEAASKYLEIGRRYRVIEKRLESSLETVHLLLSFHSEARGNFLEMLIVLLIIVEIALYLLEIL